MITGRITERRADLDDSKNERRQGEQAGAGNSGGHQPDPDQKRLQRRNADHAAGHRPDRRAGDLHVARLKPIRNPVVDSIVRFDPLGSRRCVSEWRPTSRAVEIRTALEEMPLLELLAVYTNWAHRLIPPRPRKVRVLPEFSEPQAGCSPGPAPQS